MSKRIDIADQIFSDIYVLKFERNVNSHALYKCLCMLCNNTFESTYSNLTSGNTKSCQSCGQKSTNYIQEYEIQDRLNKQEKISQITKDYNVNRGVIYRIKKEINSNRSMARTTCSSAKK